MVICDQFWDKFIAVAENFPHWDNDKEKYVYDPEHSDIYDVFNAIRERANGGWKYTDEYLTKIDQEILEEEERDARRFSLS